MLRIVASFFKPTETSNTCEGSTAYVTTTITENSKDIYNEPNFEDTEQPREGEEEGDIALIQSLRQQKQRELAQKVLLRKIAHQSRMSRYAQDHLPLSKVQEKLEEDNLPLSVLQERLKERDEPSIYTTIKENINFLLYSKSSKFNRSRRSSSLITDNNNATTSISNSEVSTPKDYRDYDIWDDAIIGRLMNLIDTIGIDELSQEISEEISEKFSKETTTKVESKLIKEVTKEVMKEVMKVDYINNSSPFSKESDEDTIVKDDKEKTISESSDAVNNNDDDDDDSGDDDDADDAVDTINVENIQQENIQENIQQENIQQENTQQQEKESQENIVQDEAKNESIKMAEEIINFGETINVAESLLHFKRSRSRRSRSEDSTNSTRNVKRRSVFSLGQSQNSKSLKRTASDLERKGSIHSRKSYENDISRRSSISSKYSVNAVTTNTIEEVNEDDPDNIKFHYKYSTTKKDAYNQKSNKSNLQFLKNLWKQNQNLSSSYDEEFLSSMERYNTNNIHRELNRFANLQQSKVESVATRSNPDYSNFYLAMPNGKWMVRTRTASRKITGTQYIDKEFI